MHPNDTHQMNELLNCLHQHRQPEGGLAFPAVWQPLKLDYTPESIKRINKLLTQIRVSSEYTSRHIRQKKSGENFLNTLAAYLCNYIAKHSKDTPQWNGLGSITIAQYTFNALEQICHAIDKPNCEINLDLPLWQALYTSIDADKNELRHLVLGRFLAKQPVPASLAYQSALNSIHFNFSEDSLQQVDKLFTLLRKHQSLRPETVRQWAVQDSAHRNFMLLLGFYIGETVAKLLGQTITWNNAQRLAEVAKQAVSADFFDSIVADFGNGIVTPVLGIVEQSLSNPAVSSTGWLNYLREEETESAEHHPDHTDINQIARRAVDGFMRQKSLDGSPVVRVGYDEELRAIGFDYSLRSISRIDRLLNIIRTSQPEFTRFAATPETQNFLHLCAFYLARTAAMLSHNSLKFINFQEARQLQPNLSNEFFHRYGALIGGKLCFPLQHLTAQIWQQPRPQTCTQWVQEWVQQHKGTLMQSLPETKPDDSVRLPLEWQIALKAAGFGAAWALWEKRSHPELMTPTLLQPEGTGINMLKLNTDSIAQAMQSGRELLGKNPDRLPHQTLIYESYANLPQGRFDAIALEVGVHQGNKPLYLFALLPFLSQDDGIINGSIAINHQPVGDMVTAHAVIQALYQGMDDFFIPHQNDAQKYWWRKNWHEQL